jgi:hypothetical protein
MISIQYSHRNQRRLQSIAPFALLIILIAYSILTIQYANAQSIPKPSIPEFKIKYVDNSYDEPSTYGIDPYTGKNVLTKEGYHVQNKSVELIIKNQPYNSYRNENGSLVWLYYNIAIKGHFEQWTTQNWESQAINSKTYDSYPTGYLPSSESEFTVKTYGLEGDNGTDTAYKYRTPTYNTPFYYGHYSYTLGNISAGGQVDFRVQAIIGYSTRINTTSSGPPIGLEPGESYHYYIFTGQTSDWSNTQTISIPADTPLNSSPTPTSSSSSTPNVTATPTSTVNNGSSESFLLITTTAALVVIAALLTVIIFLLFFMRKRRTN